MLALPLELLIEILKALEWSDLLRIRQTCHHLCDASQTISVWRNLYYRYLSNSDIHCHLEYPLCVYSAKDLESWVFRRIGADLGWKKDADQPSRQRTVQTDYSMVLSLIPGGRWLITMDGGGVKCYDLDTPTISEHVLVPASESARTSICCAIDMPDNPVTFPFHLVIYRHVFDDETMIRSQISVWKISLSGSGRSAMLMRTQLVFYSIAGDSGVTKRLSVYGKCIARLASMTWDSPPFVEIIDWTRLGHDGYSRIIYPPRFTTDISVIRDHGLLCFSNTLVVLYDIEAIGHSPASATRHSDTLPTLSIKVESYVAGMGHLSKPFGDASTTTFTIHNLSGHIQSLVLQRNPFWNFRLVKLGKYSGGSYFNLGLRRAFSGLNCGTGHLLSYPNLNADDSTKPSDENVPQCSVGKVGSNDRCFQLIPLIPLMDEETGRVVTRSQGRGNGQRLIISDYSRYVR